MANWLWSVNSILRIGLAAACVAGAVAGADEPKTGGTDGLSKRLGEVQELQSRQRYVDALLKLEEIEKEYPDVADVHTLRGSIRLAPAIRDFDAAEAAFAKAAAIHPEALAPAFNLAELPFVKHDWQQAKARFEALLTGFPQMPQAVRHLVVFKILVCQLKLEDVQGAEAALAAHFTFMDDTPAYYMAKAALAFKAKDESLAQEWIEKARLIFGGNSLATYLDSLIEARWVPNIGLPRMSEEVKP